MAEIDRLTVKIEADIGQLRRELARIAKAEKDAADAQRSFNEVMAEGEAAFAAVRTPAERYADELDRLKGLLDADAIDQDTFNRAVIRAGVNFEDASRSGQRFADAMRDLGHAVSTEFEEAIIQGKALDEVLRSLHRTITQIALRIFVTKPLEGLLEDLAKNLPNILGGIFRPSAAPFTAPIPVPKPIFHEGGLVGSTPVPAAVAPATWFENAPRFQAGGAVPAILHAGELVLNRAQQRNVAEQLEGGMAITINVNPPPGTADPMGFGRSVGQAAAEALDFAQRAHRRNF
ncbi:MAG: hypothetical protein ACE5KF_01190 [Kiloniellaceae bacterium]